MSDFWAKALGGGTPPPPAPPQPQQQQAQPAQPQPWWRHNPVPSQQPAPQAQPEQEDYGSATLNPAGAKSIRADKGGCPECGSGNYYEFKAHGSVTMRCFECGYNGLFAHSTAGAGLPSGDGTPATPTRQVVGLNNNFNPQQIVDVVPGTRG